MSQSRRRFVAILSGLFALAAPVTFAGIPGYYRQPALHNDTLIFIAEGDLWKVSASGGVATRLTSHPGDEARPAISPDGKTVAFTAQYEGPNEVYTMSIDGGLPVRRTFDAARINHVGWTPDGKLLVATDIHSTLPNSQLVTIDFRNPTAAITRAIIPLAQASDGEFADDSQTLFFTRLPFQGSHTRRYKGGTAQNIWRFKPGDAEATPLTADYPGTSKRPMWSGGRIYFTTDRNASGMNIWSMKPDGSDLKQHTNHTEYEVQGTSLSNGRIVYQLGVDLRLLDIASGKDQPITITLDSDFDQTRERWVPKPFDYLSAFHISPDGSKVALTARGQVFVAPHRQGRFIEVTRKSGVRYRDARFMPDGKSLLAMSDESGEVEFWTYPASGIGAAEQRTTDGDVLRWEGVPSPDGKWIAHYDKNQRLFIYNIEKKENRKIDESPIDDFADLAWSPDSQWLAYAKAAENTFRTIRIYSIADGSIIDATTDRFGSFSPTWSTDGKWLYFLSDRNLSTIVPSPWGAYQPEPFLDKMSKIYHIALVTGLKSPWAPVTELDPAEPKKDEKDRQKEPGSSTSQPSTTQPATSQPASAPATAPADAPKAVTVKIDAAGLATRLFEVPIAAGNYGGLSITEKAIFFTSRATGEFKTNLSAVTIARENIETKTVLADIAGYELSADTKKLLVRKGDSLYIIDAAADEAKLDKKDVNLSGWSLAMTPREEWRQMFTEAWRLERDYFYDRGMHGTNWSAMLKKYLPLVDRVSTRAELNDAIAQMVAELSALHIFVRGGDLRQGPDQIDIGSLAAEFTRDENAGGYRIVRLYEFDPDMPAERGPLSAANVDAKVGDVITAINGTPTLSVPHLNQLLRKKVGQQVLVHIKPAIAEPATSQPAERDAIVVPISTGAAENLRYNDWEFTRRKLVDALSGGRIGYVHLRAMGGGNFTEWARNFYPVFNREGLIVDVRHNRGGNIDSWILGRLMRKAWFYWSSRVGQPPSWNMQYAFRGHVAVLCNERTASDGEAFTEGVKRLKLGKVFGTRTWGGEIWLSSSNFLGDGGIATAAETGVFGPEGEWLIEGHGVEPDVVIDNPPHATFMGEDAQLKAAVDYLLQKAREEPVAPVKAPKHPDKSR